jgi:hypothetical protein
MSSSVEKGEEQDGDEEVRDRSLHDVKVERKEEADGECPDDSQSTGSTLKETGGESYTKSSTSDTVEENEETLDETVRKSSQKLKIKPIQLKDVAELETDVESISTPSLYSPDDNSEQCTVYSGVTFVGSSAVDAPCSEIEMNRVMGILKKQGGEAIDVHLSIPSSPKGCIKLFDAENNQQLSVYRIRHVLFCARGKEEGLKDCLSFTTGYKNADVFHCHVFRCGDEDACAQVLRSIGKAFQNPERKKEPSPARFETHEFDFDVTVDILEEDSKGGFSSVARDRECFKVRQNIMKRISVTVTQTGNKPLAVQRCFGILAGPGRNLEDSKLQLLEMVFSGTVKEGKAYEVVGAWNPFDEIFQVLNTETPKYSNIYLTVGTDFVLESIKDSIRFVRYFSSSEMT